MLYSLFLLKRHCRYTGAVRVRRRKGLEWKPCRYPRPVIPENPDLWSHEGQFWGHPKFCRWRPYFKV